jgi:hypothetical protein
MKIFQIQDDEGENRYIEIENCGMLQPFKKGRSLVAQILNAASKLPRNTGAILRFSSTERVQITSLGDMVISGVTSICKDRRERPIPTSLFFSSMLKPKGFGAIYVPSDEADNPIVVPLGEDEHASEMRNVLAVVRLP